jgi:putative ABC transport system permease protein
MLSPLRTALTVMGVAVGVAVMVAITAVNRSVLEAFRSMVDTVSGKADLTVAQGKSRFDDELVDKVTAVPGVEHVSASLSFVFPVAGMPGESLYVLGTNFTDDGYFRDLKSAKGQPQLKDVLSFLNSTDELLLSERFANKHGIKAGDKINLITPKGTVPFNVRALLDESGPVKAFGGSFAVMDLYSAEAAFDIDHQIDRIDIKAASGVDVDVLKAKVRAATGDAFEVERPERRGESVQRMLLSFQMGLNMGSALALLVGIFLVYNTISIGVVQRRREIGTLRALGCSGNQMRALFTLEAAVLGAVGSVLGVPLGWLIANRAIAGVADAISSIYIQVHASDVSVTAVEVAIGCGMGVFGSCFAAFRPASKAASVQPVEALRRDAVAGAHLGSYAPQLLLGVGLLLSTLVLARLPPPIENFPLGGYLAIFTALMGATALAPFIISKSQLLLGRPAQGVLGIAGRLATDNFARAPGRSAVPVAALSIGICMSVSLGGFIGSFKESAERWLRQGVPSDLFVTSSYKLAGVRNVPMDADLGKDIAKIPGVSAVDRIRMLPHDFSGLRIFVLSLDPTIYYRRARPIFLEGTQEEAEAMAQQQDQVMVSENLSHRRNIHKGDFIDVDTPTGVHHYHVSGVLVDYTSDQGLMAMSRDQYMRDFKDTKVDTFEVYIDDKSLREGIRKIITDNWGKQYDLYVLTNDELRAESMKLIDQTFEVTYAMEFVAVVLALLGVVNTLLAAVIDRTREIGLLRAVGATRGQVIRTIASEAGCIGIVGAVIGIATGNLVAEVLIRSVGAQGTGWEIPLIFPWAVCLQMAFAAIACAIGAGLYPARRAAQLDVVEALAYE